AQQGDQVVVVVSALSKVTDLILSVLNSARLGNGEVMEEGLRQLSERHEQVVSELFQGHTRKAVSADAQATLNHMRDYCAALKLLGSATLQVMDMVLPLGEKMSAHIFAACLNELGAKGTFVDSARIVATDDKFGDAAPDMEATSRQCREILLPLLQQGQIPVVMGYSGATAAGQVTTLGRGGSDYSGTIVGAAIDADEVWIWTDVDGVMTADPRLVPGARIIPEISYREAIELSFFGAKVLHPKTIQPVMKKKIPVWIKNSFNPACEGTKICAAAQDGQAGAKAITSVSDAVLVTMNGK